MYHSGNELVDPNLLFEKAQLHAGMHVADFGCGRTGHIVFPAAMRLGERGILYAVDILKDVLETIQQRAKSDNLLNVHTVWANIERPDNIAIPEASLDAVFFVNILFHVSQQEKVLEGVGRLLKEKARCIIVDWARKGLPFGPEDDHFIDFEKLKTWARSHGFAIQEEFPMGPFHKGLILYKHA